MRCLKKRYFHTRRRLACNWSVIDVLHSSARLSIRVSRISRDGRESYTAPLKVMLWQNEWCNALLLFSSFLHLPLTQHLTEDLIYIQSSIKYLHWWVIYSSPVLRTFCLTNIISNNVIIQDNNYNWINKINPIARGWFICVNIIINNILTAK